ncbi:hypothetical protein CHLRE_06g274994v5 [Chlamydomonas reinhardtii]|uniref:ELM2 domain-containing protein n=1 Tax=Chlamydomonas reinhardtii TaxID=3055 RepID=A0A2K3DNL4_CHLRE|nr:uncharacterized protein CHLRE_06g274994v5 [Chlamydomonas reinhardtii]PNW82123.1 hypothetical protein CHLRE_06g274994v5 [Chlamydomonas reinhardtii]
MSETPGIDLAAEQKHKLLGPATEIDSALPPKFRHKRGLPEQSPAEEATEPVVDAAAAGPSGSGPALIAPLALPQPQPQPSRSSKHPRDSPPAAALGASDDTDAQAAAPGAVPQDRERGRDRDGLGQDDDDDDEEEEDGDEDGLGVLRRGPKATRLSVSKIQGRAEPRKPRIGPQYQAVVPPWTPGL